MSETVKHTPGPWRVEEGTTLVWGDCNPDDHSTYGMGYPIAETRVNPSGNWSTGPYADEGDANARLIAAAPEMLDSGRKLANEVGGLVAFENEIRAAIGNTNWSVLMQRLAEAEAAIAKAEGRDNG